MVRALCLKTASTLQITLGDLPRLHQHRAERMRIRANDRRDHSAGLEVHDAFVVPQRGRHAQRAGLPAQVQQLEDVMDAEFTKGTLDGHYAAGSRATKMRCRSVAVRVSRRARRAYAL